jgi:hypothetical protein
MPMISAMALAERRDPAALATAWFFAAARQHR